MDARGTPEPTPMKNRTTAERTSDQELVVTRTFDAPPRIVFEAWTKAELMKRWWVPKSSGLVLLSCEVDARVGGRYRLEFDRGAEAPMAFFGTYIEVTPHSRLVWTNEESAGGSVTTLTFEERDGETLLTMHERFPTKEALDRSMGMEEGLTESFGQLDALLVASGNGVQGS